MSMIEIADLIILNRWFFSGDRQHKPIKNVKHFLIKKTSNGGENSH